MTTEHVSVPRELFDMAREQIERQRLAALEYGLIDVAEAHSYALHKIDAILSRATPSDDDFYCCNGVDCGCQGITKREYAEACSKNPSAPRVVTAELSNTIAGDIAEHLRNKGWSSGGDYQDDFLPDVEIATRAALDSFATSLPAARVPDEKYVRDELIEASSKSGEMG
jgi:hypothetical protein